MNSLEVDSINKLYNGKVILSNIYLKCETNNIIGIFGRNGSGKSTLLKIIFGSLYAENKFIKINGVVKNSSNKVIKGISYLSQEDYIPNYLSVSKAINLSISKSKIDDFKNDELIENIITKKISSLSRGESKYLHVKMTLYSDAEFCLLDEPYSGVSPTIIEKINELIVKQSKVKGIIVTDHNYQSLLKIVNKYILLKDGTTYHLKNKEQLINFGYLSSNMLDK